MSARNASSHKPEPECAHPTVEEVGHEIVCTVCGRVLGEVDVPEGDDDQPVGGSGNYGEEQNPDEVEDGS